MEDSVDVDVSVCMPKTRCSSLREKARSEHENRKQQQQQQQRQSRRIRASSAVAATSSMQSTSTSMEEPLQVNAKVLRSSTRRTSAATRNLNVRTIEVGGTQRKVSSCNETEVKDKDWNSSSGRRKWKSGGGGSSSSDSHLASELTASSSQCFATANETKAECERAGLGVATPSKATTVTTTMTRLKSRGESNSAKNVKSLPQSRHNECTAFRVITARSAGDHDDDDDDDDEDEEDMCSASADAAASATMVKMEVDGASINDNDEDDEAQRNGKRRGVAAEEDADAVENENLHFPTMRSGCSQQKSNSRQLPVVRDATLNFLSNSSSPVSVSVSPVSLGAGIREKEKRKKCYRERDPAFSCDLVDSESETVVCVKSEWKKSGSSAPSSSAAAGVAAAAVLKEEREEEDEVKVSVVRLGHLRNHDKWTVDGSDEIGTKQDAEQRSRSRSSTGAGSGLWTGSEEKSHESLPLRFSRSGSSMPQPQVNQVDGQEAARATVPPLPPPSSSQQQINLNLNFHVNPSTSQRASTSSKKGARSGSASSKSSRSSSRNAQPPPLSFSSSATATSGRARGGAVVRNKVSEVCSNVPVSIPAPALLMNDLPYMGELTFDTRPRRGRKPKKADICHLISKNYGITFPLSAQVNVAKAAVVAPSPAKASSKKSSASCKSSNSSISKIPHVVAVQPVAASPSQLQAQSHPALQRIASAPAFSNKDVSIVPILPSLWNPAGVSSDSTISVVPNSSKALPFLQQQQQSSRASTPCSPQSISMLPLQLTKVASTRSEYKEERDDDQTMDLEQWHQDRDNLSDNEDSPLNLCMRDKDRSRASISFEPLSLRGRTSSSNSLDVRWNRLDSKRNFSPSETGALPPLSSPRGSRGVASSSSASSNTNPASGATRSASSKLNASFNCNSSNNINNDNSNEYSVNSVSEILSSLVSRRQMDNLLRPISSSADHQNAHASHSHPTFSIAQHLNAQQSEGMGGNRPKTADVTTPRSGTSNKPGTSRKKKELGVRGDVSISACGPDPLASPNGSSAPALSTFGGTLFGQATTGMSDGAVSICKFKFTGGAKPCLQEKKMLSVDSGGNFRFYTDKASNTAAAKHAKAQSQQHFPPSTFSSSSALSTSFTTSGGGAGGGGGLFSDQHGHSSTSGGLDGGGNDNQFLLSSLPKSARSMSMCMSIAGNSPVQMVSSTSTPSASSSSSTLCSSKARAPIASRSTPLLAPRATSSTVSISPTIEELHQFHLSLEGQQSGRSSDVSPFQSGDFSCSSSNSGTSSDNSNDNSPGIGSKLRSSSGLHGSQFRQGCGSGSSKVKLKRKRRTRKSLMREKLEKTFKEKGFLIQTQQLESAEGATYCKFRQLRKFTRYLFRSWKDYLPDHVKEISDTSAAAAAAAAAAAGSAGSIPLPGHPQGFADSPCTGSENRHGDAVGETMEDDEKEGNGFMGAEEEMDADEDDDDDEEADDDDEEEIDIDSESVPIFRDGVKVEKGDEERGALLEEASPLENKVKRECNSPTAAEDSSEDESEPHLALERQH